MVIPTWLESLLSTPFFYVCPLHKDAPRSECNMFCLDCHRRSFCFYCRSDLHHDHRVIQIRRSSYHDVVRVAEIEKILDISEIQTYVINSARVLFLNERPQPKSSASKGGTHVCEICSRCLLDPFRFCSLGCKVKNEDSNFYPNEQKHEEMSRRRERIGRRLGEEEEEEEEEEELRVRRNQEGEIYQNHTHPSHSNSRRRKGIPQRAPF
ncbi:hypothetical protein SDJN02_01006 [Cucurbita argyrosperma subsp. argyrosperma]|nr:hypothetical protein SDJN02_01006 [Cucurbita argyrosperma subsp. argyrosperma]